MEAAAPHAKIAGLIQYCLGLKENRKPMPGPEADTFLAGLCDRSVPPAIKRKLNASEAGPSSASKVQKTCAALPELELTVSHQEVLLCIGRYISKVQSTSSVR